MSQPRNALIAGFLGWTLDAFDFFVLSFVINDVAKAFGKTRPEIVLTITLALAMRPLGALIFGLMADRFGRRTPLMLSVLAYAFFSVLSGLAPTYAVFVAMRLCFGIAMGGEWGIGASLALESAPAKWRGVVSGFLQEGYATGYLLAAVVYRTVYPHFGWRWMFFVGGIPALLTLFIRAKVQESPAWHEHKTDWASYKKVLFGNARRFVYLVVLMTTMNFISHGTQDMYPTFLQQQRHFSVQATADITIISMIGAILGGVIVGWFSDRFGRKKAMITSVIGCLLLIPLWITAPTTGLIVLGVFLMQFCVQGAWGVVPAHINELSPRAAGGFFPGMAYQLGVLFASSIPWIESMLGEHLTYAQSMGTLAGSVLVLGLIAIAFGPEARGISFRK